MFGLIVPLIMSAVSAYAAKKAGDKARKSAQLDPATQRMQDQAMQYQQARMMMTQPIFERLAQGMQTRLPASYGAPSIDQMRTPGAGQAISQLARGVPGPTRRRVRADQA